ncbi:MAG TPA: hypothetical protein VNH64_07890 [Parvularculaceae bacterium]|nr:hypothetical protein [Parvularculaceae bacterium]
MATPALATPTYGGAFRVAETAGDAPRKEPRVSPLASLFLFRFFTDAAASPSDEKRDAEPANGADPAVVVDRGCRKDDDTTATQKDETPVKRFAAGPEPIYLAF